MTEVRFIELQSITAKCFFSGIQTCVHFSTEQCQECIHQDDAERERLQSLCEGLHTNDALDKDERATVLEEIARLTLCYAHGEEEDIDAAVIYWEAEIQSRVSTTQPQTPTADNTRDFKPLSFDHYHTPRSNKKADTRMAVDDLVREQLLKIIKPKTDIPSYLYVFSDKRAPGLYKIGSGNALSRPTKGWEKCHPDSELHCFIECPNAKGFERVMHAELAPYRRKHKCNTCTSEHWEWFEAPLPDILDSVRAWSLYASMFYRYSPAIDGESQILRRPGLSSRDDRWRKWALEEAMRWMNGMPRHISSPQGAAPPDSTRNTTSGYKADSETESTASTASTASSPASPSDTPGTTPATTPGSFGNESDYGLSPTPGARYNTCKEGAIDEDNDGLEDTSQKPVNRALFKPNPSSSGPPNIVPEDTLSTKTEDLDLSKDSADSGTQSPATNTPSSTWVDRSVRKVLERNTSRLCKPGTVYLTPRHPEKESYKIYHRKGNYSRTGQCYSNLTPYLEMKCTDPAVIEDLVLAEFGHWTDKGICAGKGCETAHTNWINMPGDAISDSVKAWAALLDKGYDRANIPQTGFSQDTDRWTKWAQDTAAKGKHGRVKDFLRRASTFLRGEDKAKSPV